MKTQTFTYSARTMRPRSNKTVKLINRKPITINGNVMGVALIMLLGLIATIMNYYGLINY